MKRQKKRRLYEGVIKYHDLFGVFLNFDKEMPRAVRFALYYLRINLLITLSALFSQRMDQIQAILVSAITASFLVIPTAIIKILLTM